MGGVAGAGENSANVDPTTASVWDDDGVGLVVSEFGLRGSIPATDRNASRSAGGKSLPRFSARRKIPRQAVALKKYRRGTSPVSKMSDNEDAAPSLGYSEVLSVKNSVGDPIPELPQDSEKGSKRPSVVNRQDAGHVLPHQPAGP
jgi:hypothetical protein